MSEQDGITELDPIEDAGPGNDTDAAAKPEGQPPDSAKSSDAQDATNADDDLLSVAREVISGKVNKAEAASSAENPEAEPTTGSQVAKEPDDENFSDVPFHKHPRFKQVLGRMKAAEVDAGRYRNVDRFISSQGMGAEEAAEALVIAGLMKNNPAEAWKQLQPILQNLLVAAGEALPPDLQRQVDAGELPHAAALQISRANASTQSLRTQQELRDQQAETERRTSHASSLSKAADDWEDERNVKDPNFPAKLPALHREIAWLHRSEGVPNSVDGVKDQLKRAYETINKEFRPPTPTAQPRRQPIRPIVAGNQPAASAQQKPVFNSTLDIVRSKVNQAAAS
ncbi:hypothetical protein [Methylobacterium sp. Leaf87]|uniref:hypothetical protein n=1 Tax=Methylobacterium sp. Leaf87 TaxID=1736243 RepID=UPI000A661827|nr:hypothetical protein [Methylobacterium sp. Leaf87]